MSGDVSLSWLARSSPKRILAAFDRAPEEDQVLNRVAMLGLFVVSEVLLVPESLVAALFLTLERTSVLFHVGIELIW